MELIEESEGVGSWNVLKRGSGWEVVVTVSKHLVGRDRLQEMGPRAQPEHTQDDEHPY